MRRTRELARATREQTVMLDEFIDDARSVLGVLKIDAATLPLDELIVRAVERASPLLSLHAISADYTPIGGVVTVDGDDRRLTRLLYRLIAAVARRAREGSTVQIGGARHSDRVQLRISVDAARIPRPQWPSVYDQDVQ